MKQEYNQLQIQPSIIKYLHHIKILIRFAIYYLILEQIFYSRLIKFHFFLIHLVHPKILKELRFKLQMIRLIGLTYIHFPRICLKDKTYGNQNLQFYLDTFNFIIIKRPHFLIVSFQKLNFLDGRCILKILTQH